MKARRYRGTDDHFLRCHFMVSSGHIPSVAALAKVATVEGLVHLCAVVQMCCIVMSYVVGVICICIYVYTYT